MKKSSLETTCFSTSIFSRFWLHFGCFWEALGPLLGGFGRPKCAPRGWGSLRQALFFSTCLVFVAALSISFDLGRFGEDFGRVLGRFGMVLGWFGEGFWLDLRIWGEGFQQRALCVFACLVAWVFGDVNKKLQPRKRAKRYSVAAASRGHNNKMLIYSFSLLHFPCGCHFLGHSIWPGGMREAIRRPTAGGAAC